MIKITELTKIYRSSSGEVLALEKINLEIERGEIFGIIGLSGAGKSTLIRCINMLEKPTSGQVVVNGLELTSLPPKEIRRARQNIGMIFQHFNLLSSRTVAENVAFPLEIAGKSKGEIKTRVSELLEMVGLAEKTTVYPSQLSGGQKQRVGIARALANNPEVLLSDEATSALDPDTTRSILSLLKEINQRLALTIVIITHEMGVIKDICDRVAVIEDARIVEQGMVLDLFTSPKTATAKRFVDSVIRQGKAVAWTRQHVRGTLVRLSFVGEAAGDPLISQLVRRYDVDTNILHGTVDRVKDTTFGTLVVEIRGERAAVDQAFEFLKSRGIVVEVIDGE